jgi:glycosyltransferase involved in cell wall biosynthesis
MQVKLSVVIITYNEEKNIERCLSSVAEVADEIVVIDSFSTDRTKEICIKNKVVFIEKEWMGYSESKNYGNTKASNNWILSLDADEALSKELINAILDFKKKPNSSCGKFNRLTNYCGSWIKHGGWYPDAKIRIFDRSVAKWSGSIHEKLTFSTPTKVVHLAGDCLHYSYYNIEQHYAQADKFTTIAAKDLFERGKIPSYIKLYVSPIIKFVRDYLFKLGFLDGQAGFTIARISAYATYLKYAKTKQLQQTK